MSTTTRSADTRMIESPAVWQRLRNSQSPKWNPLDRARGVGAGDSGRVVFMVDVVFSAGVGEEVNLRGESDRRTGSVSCRVLGLTPSSVRCRFAGKHRGRRRTIL